MADAGWYPDPSGAPGQLRYFDGRSWTSQVVAQGQDAGGGTAGRGGLVAAIVGVLALSLLVWFLLRPGGGDASGFPEDTNSASPSITGWDETSVPTPTPTPSTTDPSGAARVECPRSGGGYGYRSDGNRRLGGQLSFESRGWSRGGFSMPFAHDVSAERRTIRPGWQSNLAVGALLKADGFDDPARSAKMMTDCFASSSYFRGYTGNKVLTTEAVTIDGKPGHRMVTEIYVSEPADVTGDRVTVIVVDTGHPDQFSFFVSAATITDPENIAEVQQTEQTVRVVS
ncbi:DUF2510 domain-containing protein [Tessaracoccus sp. SD287]|uniref:DUF2510 domain-containing protein n=1 Tax=Tessaracoccus sp. SD287 TaxID=2782008 RepID=UPI001A968913|nr:DUF2510 domain-containing protein [Tessaracoccus sp. SD287]MBO1031506.1 DUF2510 domain-containing protein [Tessaracoccus sp. SD287]